MNWKKRLAFTIFLLFLLPFQVSAEIPQIESFQDMKGIGLALHAIEIALAIFIAYMALNFFRITRPVNLFFFLYVGVGFFIISSLMYVLFYYSLGTQREISIISVYFAERVSLIGMLISFLVLFYQWNKMMKQQQ